MNGPRCSEASFAVGEALAGTAVDAVHTWLLLELNERWAPKPIDSGALEGAPRARIESWLDDHPGTRLQLIRRPGRPSTNPFLMVVDSRSRRVGRVELDDYASLSNVDFDALRRGASPMDSSIVLVCVHGRRDRCCAEHGSVFFRALSRNGVDVWQTSHLGGHRFAACALWLPDGLMYGRLRKEDANAFVEAQGARQLGDLERFRGRCAYDRPTQAAEIFIRRHTRDLAIDSLVWHSTESESESVWRVRFDAGEEAHTVRVERRIEATSRPASCGGEAEPVTQFAELS